MRKYWIHSPLYDILFFLSPPFLILAFIFLFQNQIEVWQEVHSLITWLILIVFVDVAHVYATLFKTYFNPKERNYYKKYLYLIPVVAFILGGVLYYFGASLFWSVMAYIAVFHFIRQQYGFLRLYTKNDMLSKRWLDQLMVYNATIFPMLYWFLSPKRKYNWFMEKEFFSFPCPTILGVLKIIYFSILILYFSGEIDRYRKHHSINFPKNIFVVGTSISWYFGIVYFNSDIIFTLLNVISHGIPYIALVYSNQKNEKHIKIFPRLNKAKGILIFVSLILVFAFFEESLWDIFIWNEHIVYFDKFRVSSKWEIIIVPLLTVPQFTHYLLDGIIWKRKENLVSH